MRSNAVVSNTIVQRVPAFSKLDRIEALTPQLCKVPPALRASACATNSRVVTRARSRRQRRTMRARI
eukprot:6533181-Lingulodinium_polyedra.AAC.1